MNRMRSSSKIFEDVVIRRSAASRGRHRSHPRGDDLRRHDVAMPSRPLGEARRAFDPLRHARADDDPAASTSGLDQSLRAELRQRSAKGVPGDAEPGAELALRREPAAGLQPAGEDVGLDPPKHLDRGQVLAVDVPAAGPSRSVDLVRALTLVHRWSTLRPVKVNALYGLASGRTRRRSEASQLTVDVVCVGDPYLDLIFRGLPALPVAGDGAERRQPRRRSGRDRQRGLCPGSPRARRDHLCTARRGPGGPVPRRAGSRCRRHVDRARLRRHPRHGLAAGRW